MYDAKIIADSLAPSGGRLTTFEISIPKWVQAELNTHRMLARNSASSRAIPVPKMIARILKDPVIPVWWGKNQAGMQADEELDQEGKEASERIWRMAGSTALKVVEGLVDIGLHKQVANRLIEPWMFTTVIVSATQWKNFFNLRCHPAAQPELRRVAVIMRTLYEVNVPTYLLEGQWHLPYVTPEEGIRLLSEGFNEEEIRKISVGRCARVSYLTHDGERLPQADIDLYEKLLAGGHMSPTEHVARALSRETWEKMARRDAENWINFGLPVGNFWGFEQLRKTIPNEHVFMEEAA